MTTALHEARLAAVTEALTDAGAASILDLGCGDGALLLRLARLPALARIVGIDDDPYQLATLRRALATQPEAVRAKVRLLETSLTAAPHDLSGFDAAVLVETLEHLPPARLGDVERTVFARLAPRTVVVTTPNADFNPLLGVPAHRLRHPDHRFEWGRARFARWAEGVASRNGYATVCRGIADTHPTLGGPSQMAIFTRQS